MTSFTIRIAAEADALEIADEYAGLHRDQWAESGAPPGGDHEPDWLAEVRQALDEDDTRLLVAESDGQVIGTARVEFAERPFFRIAEVHRLYVRPQWRRRGVATELMRVAEDAARDGGARDVRLTVVTENEGAIRFYRELGYDDFAVRLHKRLPPGEG